jgi:hypothetical protein
MTRLRAALLVLALAPLLLVACALSAWMVMRMEDADA